MVVILLYVLFSGYELENMGLFEADPSILEYQPFTMVNGQAEDPPLTGTSLISSWDYLAKTSTYLSAAIEMFSV